MTQRRPIVTPSVKPGIPRVDRFPSTWRRVPFGELLEPAFRPIKLEPARTYQLVIAKRNRGGIAPRERVRGDQIKTPGQFALRAGDFVIAKRQIIHGGCGFVPEELDGAIVSGEYDVFRPRPHLAPTFLRWFTHTTYFQQTCYQSSIGVDVEKMIFQTDRWLRVPMPLPSADHQAKIAFVLDAVEAAEGVHDKAIATQRRLKRALLQQLLTGRRRFPEYRSNAWPARELCRVGRVASGATPSTTVPANWDGDVPWCTPTDITALRGPWLRETKRTISRTGLQSCAAELLPVGSIVVCTRATIGAAAITAVPLATNQGFKSIVPNKDMDSPFIYYAIINAERDLLRHGAGSTFAEVSKTSFESIAIPAPSKQEQERVGAVLLQLDAELELLERQLSSLRKLKRGLMQKLLTGELEVPTERNPTMTEVLA